MSPKLHAFCPLISPPKPCAPSSRILRPYLSATFLISGKLAGSPNKSTGTTTLGLSFPSAITPAIAFSNELASMLKVSSSTSTKTGVAPRIATTSPDEKNVKSGTNTASPSPIPQAISASSSASVPFPQVTQCFTPTYAASFSSSSETLLPPINLLLAITSSIWRSMSFLSAAYCFFKSLNSIIFLRST